MDLDVFMYSLYYAKTYSEIYFCCFIYKKVIENLVAWLESHNLHPQLTDPSKAVKSLKEEYHSSLMG